MRGGGDGPGGTILYTIGYEVLPPALLVAELQGGRRAFAAHIKATAADELDVLAAELIADAPPTALMCLEAEAGQCHRGVLADVLVARQPSLEVVDL